MGVIFLTSTGFHVKNCKDAFLSTIRNNSKATIITTAHHKKEETPYAKQAKEKLLEMGFSDVSFLDIECEDPRSLLPSSAIYLMGGNPFHLLNQIRLRKVDVLLKEALKENTILIGVSAGAMVLGRDIKIAEVFTSSMNQKNIQDLTGLQLIDRPIFPHYDREDLFPGVSNLEARIQRYEMAEECEVIRIRDNEFVKVNHDLE